MTADKIKKAYHFLKDDMTSGYGNEPAWKVGEEREVDGQLVMCKWGYHASTSFYDALKYAPGSMACIVELSGEIIKDTDKYVARKRKLVKVVNAEKALRYFACDCAERALKKANVTDERSWNAIKVARLYNEGKATKKELKTARAAAGAAWEASIAAREASVAAWAAWKASGDAWDAWEASGDAWDTWKASGDAWAAWKAARKTEIKWQKRRLNWYMNKEE